MIQNFRVKNAKDIETPQESILNNTNFAAATGVRTKSSGKDISSITAQHFPGDTFDTFIEKKNKR